MILLAQKYAALLDRSEDQPEAIVEGMRTCFEVLSLTAAIDRDCAARLGLHDLSEGKFVLLFLLQDAEDGLSPHELAERAGITRGTVTGLVDGLERSGLVQRASNDIDRRKLTIRLTAGGAALIRRLTGEHSRWIGSLLSDLSAAERDTLRHLLAKVFARTDAGTRKAAAHGA
ncbi:MarR family transcriptional regulator [Methylobacterium tarhaniae]|uniref:MarR family transcriptional regulator n=1 Tax=Methylobacterium tarhaniae TaxID=1187852 RepID=A0A0J6TEH9_9HYPH|nr:MarR family transcriptional regulator [Methylobacterium tarhaniae]KMO44058.1 MarR family transcriptional regulator [Methylobacterium tarhaniae]